MGNEAQMWSVLRKHLAGADPVRVENPAHPGTPDVNFIEGWAELKNRERWPVRTDRLSLPHPPTKEQRVWLYRRWNAGGNCWLILRVHRDWLLFRGCDVLELWRGGNPLVTDLLRHAVVETIVPGLIAEKLKQGRT